MIYKIIRTPPNELRHYGIKGQSWGKRRFQNEDGTWTSEGQERYSTDTDGEYGESGGESQKERDTRVERKRKQKPKKPKKMSKRQLKKEQKRAIEAAKKEQLKSERTSKLMNKGMKALNLYMSYQSFKEEWY